MFELCYLLPVFLYLCFAFVYTKSNGLESFHLSGKSTANTSFLVKLCKLEGVGRCKKQCHCERLDTALGRLKTCTVCEC